MCKDAARQDAHPHDFLKTYSQVLLHGEDVVVPHYQSFVTVESADDAQMLALHGHVTQMVHMVLWFDGFIPVFHYFLIHFLNGIE